MRKVHNHAGDKYPHRAVIIFLFISAANLVRALLWIMPSPLMEVIRSDLNINYAEAGMMLSIVSAMMGAAMFAGSIILDRLGTLRTLAVSFFLFIFDGILCTIQARFQILMIGRFMTGAGFGLASTATAALISEYYTPEQRRLVNGLNLAVNSLSITLAYSITVPVFQALGSWRYVNLLWSISSLAVLTVLTILMSVHYFDEEGEKETTKSVTGKGGSSLCRVLQFRTLRLLSVAMIGAVLLYNGLINYFPTFLAKTRGMSSGRAGIVTSVISAAGIAGSLMSGSFPSLSEGSRGSMIIFLDLLLTMGSAVGMLNAESLYVICFFAAVLGIAYFGMTPIGLTMIMNTPGVTPQMAGASLAIYSGVGMVFTLFLPNMFEILQALTGIRNALQFLCLPMIISLLSVGCMLGGLQGTRRILQNRKEN